MKRDYLKPTIRVVKMQQRQYLLTGSNDDPYPDGGNGIKSRGFRGDWDDVEE